MHHKQWTNTQLQNAKIHAAEDLYVFWITVIKHIQQRVSSEVIKLKSIEISAILITAAHAKDLKVERLPEIMMSAPYARCIGASLRTVSLNQKLTKV